MTANEDALDLDAIDLFEITDKWLQTCPSCDAGLPATCTHPADDYRNVVSDLVDALAFARAEIDRLRSRASIGPDSERIRELEAENAALKLTLAGTLEAPDLPPLPNDAQQQMIKLREGLRAAGLLPGDIVISRALVERVLESAEVNGYTFRHALRAALSQPRPAQEQTPPSFVNLKGAIMRICPRCGDKRCPLANIPTATCINRAAQEQQT